ncbi:uncharacterized protein FFB20_10577 [Fusarium fujikuroi]|nr:uncharacterized protein FFB20_10577 [Fusarium fujikuroi]SCN99499.1 uncharacterized protein FFC1_08191 [Fusarium fujikuroi]SCO09530.1 uncharacterized protein FFE2_11778 [Fusarium fujikuroi]SCO16142.1 uncharacterized protein FFM5_11159 [Fusarium fujikuroi]SCO49144.1 uncharacterized protein FFNC_12454 [Fusarium fujikuroi]
MGITSDKPLVDLYVKPVAKDPLNAAYFINSFC